MAGLTVVQAREIKRNERLDDFLEHEDAVVQSYAPLKLEVAEFRINKAGLLAASEGKNTESTWITKDKTDLKEEIAHDSEYICAITAAFAEKYNHHGLLAAVNFSHDKIFRMRDENILSFVNGVKDAIVPYLTDADFTPYDIKAEDLDALKEKATAFSGMIGEADEAETHNTTDNSDIDAWIRKTRANIRRMEKLVVRFKKDKPLFVQGFILNSAVDMTGIRHNGIEGTVSDEQGNAVPNATVRLRGTDHEVVTDLRGDFRLVEARPGDYIAEVFAEGFVPHEGLTHISARKVIDKDFVLKRLP